jgi:lipopolysaccharide export system protein LptC
MHGRSAIWFPLALLALLAALSFWIERTVQPPQPKRDGSSRHDPDYTVDNFVMNKADRDGNPRNTLAAVSMVHFPDDDSTQLVRPRYTQYSQRKPTMQIQGQRGLVSSNGENVYFMDNVKVVREATGSKGELTLLTEYLHLIPDQEIARTDHPVRILQAPHTTVTGTGMELDHKLRTFQLFHNVHVHYERPGTPAGKPASMPPPPVNASKHEPKAAAPQITAQKPKNTALKPEDATQKSAGKPVRKTKRGKPRTEKTKPATGKSNSRIRRHYETNTPR